MQRQIYVWQGRGRTKGWQSLGFQQSRDLGSGWVGSQLPWARLSEGRPYLFLLLTTRIKISSLDHNPLKRDAQSQWGIVWAWLRWSKPLPSQDEESIPLTTWGTRGAHPPLPAGPSLLSQTPRSSHLLRALTTVSVLGACAFEPKIGTSPKVKGPDLCRPGSSISIPRSWENAK